MHDWEWILLTGSLIWLLVFVPLLVKHKRRNEHREFLFDLLQDLTREDEQAKSKNGAAAS